MIYTFISGATGGIGKAFTLECAKNGYNLFLTGRSEEKLSLLKDEVLKLNDKIDVQTFATDLTNKDQRYSLFENAKNKTAQHLCL